VLHWHPDEARQLVVASDDDRSPTLQMWDLRNSAAPLKEFVGHTKVTPTGPLAYIATHYPPMHALPRPRPISPPPYGPTAHQERGGGGALRKCFTSGHS
jgi:hypothetical protein